MHSVLCLACRQASSPKRDVEYIYRQFRIDDRFDKQAGWHTKAIKAGDESGQRFGWGILFLRFKRIILTDHSKIRATVPLTYKDKSLVFPKEKKNNHMLWLAHRPFMAK